MRLSSTRVTCTRLPMGTKVLVTINRRCVTRIEVRAEREGGGQPGRVRGGECQPGKVRGGESRPGRVREGGEPTWKYSSPDPEVFCFQAKQEPEKKPGWPQETAASFVGLGLTAALTSLGVAFIARGVMVGAFSPGWWVRPLPPSLLCLSQFPLPPQSPSASELSAQVNEVRAEFSSRLDAQDTKLEALNKAFISLRATTERVIIEVDNLEQSVPRRR